MREPPTAQFDQYGFLVTEKNRRAVEALEDPAILRKDNNRLLKWQDMFVQWDLYTTRRIEKLEDRAWKGVPDAVRSELWKRRSAPASAISSRKYFRLLQETISPRFDDLILSDCARTFPTHEFFLSTSSSGTLSPNTDNVRRLQNMLRAYAVLDRECGYVQGMSYIAAVPLFYMVEEDAFWVFVFMMTRLGFREYFLQGTPQIVRSTELLCRLVATQLPRLHAHLERYGVTPAIFTAPWFLTVFAFSLPFPVALRCWDWVFVVGHDALFVVALTVLKLKQAELLNVHDDELVEAVMRLTTDIDINALEFVSTAQQFKGLSKEIEQLKRTSPELQANDSQHQQLWQTAITSNTDPAPQ